MITLSDGTTTVTLHPDLMWSDENEWHPVEQAVQRSLTGALIVSAATRIKGRNITLKPQNESSAWMQRAAVDQLRNWASVAGKQLVLTLRGNQYDVIFRHHESPALEATPIVHFNDVDAADWYSVTLKLTEI